MKKGYLSLVIFIILFSICYFIETYWFMPEASKSNQIKQAWVDATIGLIFIIIINLLFKKSEED